MLRRVSLFQPSIKRFAKCAHFAFFSNPFLARRLARRSWESPRIAVLGSALSYG